MPSYLSDRAFTDLIHSRLALPLIYAPLGWQQVALDEARARELDTAAGIDYTFKDGNGRTITVQERFREVKYKTYTDFTIRYRRDGNVHADRRQSEYYKMKADYFVYGITNGTKEQPGLINGYEKFAVINLAKVYERLDAGDILIQDNGRNFCSLTGGKIICPVKYNRDDSSSFFPIDISYLARLWPYEMIIAQQGFL